MNEGKTVKAKSVRQIQAEATNPAFGENRTLYATVAYHFPQYKLEDVENMPYRDVALLLKTAEKIEAGRMYNLTMIASAPQSKNGKGVKTLMEHFRKLLKG
jgi:vancomycin permeability regulator SanA